MSHYFMSVLHYVLSCNTSACARVLRVFPENEISFSCNCNKELMTLNNGLNNMYTCIRANTIVLF